MVIYKLLLLLLDSILVSVLCRTFLIHQEKVINHQAQTLELKNQVLMPLLSLLELFWELLL